MLSCPTCNMTLRKTTAPRGGVFWICPSCGGRAATISFLRKDIPLFAINDLWQSARSDVYRKNRACPACRNFMTEVPAKGAAGTPRIDVCTVCQFVWFDPGEYSTMPSMPRAAITDDELPMKAREQLALIEIEKIRRASEGDDLGDNTPDAWWQWIPGVLGMPVEQDVSPVRSWPWLTWLITAVISTVSIFAFSDLEEITGHFGLVPAHFLKYSGLTFFTSFLLHGGWIHLIGNMYFLLIFGDNVEDRLGKLRFLLLLLLAALAGDIAHVISEPHSTIPCIGASGGISGVIAYYALAFPKARIGMVVRMLYMFRWVRMPAYVMFLVWMVLQFFGAWSQLSGFSNVSSIAHLGGAGTGFLFWLATRDNADLHTDDNPAAGIKC